jgi:hypothetical protein
MFRHTQMHGSVTSVGHTFLREPLVLCQRWFLHAAPDVVASSVQLLSRAKLSLPCQATG